MNKNSFHILVVDDDDRIRELVKQYLEEEGFIVNTAINASDAKKKLKIIKFDILILDIMMPGQSGLSLTKEIFGWSNKVDRSFLEYLSPTFNS